MKTMNQAADLQLVKSFQQGNDQALEILIGRYKDKIFTSIKILVKDHYLAEDMFQDVFIKIIDTLRSDRYNEEGKFLPWALRIAHNLCVDYFRKVNRKPQVKTSDDQDIFEVLNFNEPAADANMIESQDHDMVRNLLNLIPADQREVVVLRHYADMSFKEIARLTNTSINTALGRMRYGINNMRKIMEEHQMAA